MNDNEINNIPSENNPVPTEDKYNQVSYTNMEATPPSPIPDGGTEPRYGFSFKWTNLLIGAFIFFGLFSGSDIFTDDWTFYIYLAVVVVIHELGHVIVGKSFGCFIKEMQVFFLPFVSYKPKHDPQGSSWRDIKWSLGVLPLGGVTMFKSRASDGRYDVPGLEAVSAGQVMTSATSPYIEDKPAWQRLLISAAGVLFNLITFLILYIAMPYMSVKSHDFFWPLTSLSLLLALLNILPIYPLDGGTVLFALYEMITGKKPLPGFTTVCGWIGFVFIILFFWVFPEWLNGLLSSIFKFVF